VELLAKAPATSGCFTRRHRLSVWLC